MAGTGVQVASSLSDGGSAAGTPGAATGAATQAVANESPVGLPAELPGTGAGEGGSPLDAIENAASSEAPNAPAPPIASANPNELELPDADSFGDPTGTRDALQQAQATAADANKSASDMNDTASKSGPKDGSDFG